MTFQHLFDRPYRSAALASIEAWITADRHLDLLEEFWREFATASDWPAIADLERQLVRKGWRVYLESECRNAPPGIFRDWGSGRFGLTVRALSRVAAAEPYLTSFIWLLQYGVKAFLRGDEAVESKDLAVIPGTWTDRLPALGRMARIEQPMQGLAVNMDGSWRWPLDAQLVLRYEGVATVEDYLELQASLIWPTDVPPPEPARELEERDRRRRDFLDIWFAWRKEGPSLAELVSLPAKSGSIAPRFEIGIANACAALGMSVFFGGAALKHEGVDFVGFDSDAGSAMAFSVTVGNQISKKLATMVPVINKISQALEPEWRVAPLIITTDRLEDCPKSQVLDAQQEGVRLLTSEDIACLASTPPDLDGWAGVLRLALGGERSTF